MDNSIVYKSIEEATEDLQYVYATTIRVRDGEQIVIAGLVTTNTIDIESKFPLLWRIPWIGKKVFTHTTEEQQKTDLIIQVKPTIVKDNYSGIDKQYYHKDAEGTLETGAKKRQY